jgi:hypothetical protein
MTAEKTTMNCQNHPESPASAYCRTCGMPVCEECRRDAFGTVYCAEHAPAPVAPNAPPPGYVPPGFAPPAYAPPPGAMPPPGYAPPLHAQSTVSPALAFFLGMIPKSK